MKIKIGKDNEYLKYKNVNADGYGMVVVRYAENWANLMEAEVNKGKSISEIAKETSHTADTEGITGFMYGCAVQSLSEFWEHGEELRKWHNLDTQIGNEGEAANKTGVTLNPAIISIG